MSTNWRIKTAASGTWINIRVTKFSSQEQMEVDEFGLQGRLYTGTSVGRLGGLKANMEILVRSVTEEATVMAALKSRTALDLESSLDEAWIMRVVSDIERRQNITPSPAGSPQPVKHEFFLSFKLVQAGLPVIV